VCAFLYLTLLIFRQLESTIAKFMGTSEAICYADSVSCVASAVPAFSKRGDLLIIDDAANHALRTGALLSRSKCLYYKHNDMEDLERVLRGAVQRFRSSAKTQRRFIVFEGLFKQDGSIPKLDKIAELAARYEWSVWMCRAVVAPADACAVETHRVVTRPGSNSA